MNNTKKTGRITVRIAADAYNHINENAKDCGYRNMSTYVRDRLVNNVERIFYDPIMTETVQETREEVRNLVCNVAMLAREKPSDEQISKIRDICKSIYSKMDALEDKLDEIRKEVS